MVNHTNYQTKHTMNTEYLSSVIKQFKYYKHLGDKTLEMVNEDELHWQGGEDSNSIAIIVKHLSGNMKSRWTNFLTEDGEKKWRDRDAEFVDDFDPKEGIIAQWESGWNCLFNALESLDEAQLCELIYIRNQGHTVVEAINRQLCHYSYHVGQMVFIGKLLKGSEWQSLSIAKNASNQYNAEKFSQEKIKRHFTDDQ